MTCDSKGGFLMAEIIKMRDKNSITIAEGCEQFYRWCKLNGYSDYTIEFYQEIAHNFSFYTSLEQPINNFNRTLYEDYIIFLQQRGIRSTTIYTYLRGLKRILNFFMEKEFISRFKIILPKMEMPIKEVYTEEELRKLLKKPNLKKCRFTEYRNWVIVNYLIGTGQRRNTITNIKIGDLDLENKLVLLRVMKNKKETILPLTQSLVEILYEYLSYRGGSDDDYLFCAQDGSQLSNDSLTNAIRKYNHRRGVQKSSIHLFRHTFAFMAMNNNMDVMKIQRLLCHAKIDTTQNYLRQFGYAELQKNYEMYNPLETVRKKSIAREWRKK